MLKIQVKTLDSSENNYIVMKIRHLKSENKLNLNTTELFLQNDKNEDTTNLYSLDDLDLILIRPSIRDFFLYLKFPLPLNLIKVLRYVNKRKYHL